MTVRAVSYRQLRTTGMDLGSRSINQSKSISGDTIVSMIWSHVDGRVQITRGRVATAISINHRLQQLVSNARITGLDTQHSVHPLRIPVPPHRLVEKPIRFCGINPGDSVRRGGWRQQKSLRCHAALGVGITQSVVVDTGLITSLSQT